MLFSQCGDETEAMKGGADVRSTGIRLCKRQACSCELACKHMTDTSQSIFALGGSKRSQLIEELGKNKTERGQTASSRPAENDIKV